MELTGVQLSDREPGAGTSPQGGLTGGLSGTAPAQLHGNQKPRHRKAAAGPDLDGAVLTIEVFGDLTVAAGPAGRPLTIPPSARALMGCLALHAVQRPLRREALAEMLWAEAPAEASRARLRTGLWRLRQILGLHAPALCQDADRVWLDRTRVVVSAHVRFAQGIEQICALPVEAMTAAQFQELDGLIGLYCGPLLEGQDDDWVKPERARYAELYSRALERQIAAFRAQDNREGTISVARRLLDHDPYREDMHALLIEMFASSGQPQRALRQFRACENALGDDLGIDPSRARAALRGALANPESPPGLSEVILALDDSIRHLDRQLALVCQIIKDRYPAPGKSPR
ncbi:MAG: BTAD domain-containing putative transcriptional regulator [Rhizobiaceae bacterium]